MTPGQEHEDYPSITCSRLRREQASEQVVWKGREGRRAPPAGRTFESGTR